MTLSDGLRSMPSEPSILCHVLAVVVLFNTQYKFTNSVPISAETKGTQLSSQEPTTPTLVPPTTTVAVASTGSTSADDISTSTETASKTSTDAKEDLGILSENNMEKCTCGVSTPEPEDDNRLSTRVVGGSVATPHSHPWQVLILYYQLPVCSATIINDIYILTAAHCIFMMENFQKKMENKFNDKVLKTNRSIDFGMVSVVLGAHDTANLTGSEIVRMESFVVHPQHSVDEVHDIYDLAVVRLESRVRFTPHIQPVCLPTQGEQFSNQLGIIVGWGQTEFNGFRSQYLKQAKVHILTDSRCAKSKLGKHFAESPESMMCAYQYKTDTCKGDSGGPLLYRTDSGFFVQAGIVSWGIECAKAGYPGVYTEVSAFIDWIRSTTIDATFCSRP